MEAALLREDEVLPLARRAADRRIYAIGGGPSEATALEAVIKVREAAQGWIDGLPLEQFLHGPLVVSNPGDVAVIVHVAGRASQRTGEVARVLAGVGVETWVIGEPIDGLEPLAVFALPTLPEPISPLLTVLGVQLLAYHMAVVRKINPDLFRRDDPAYAAALRTIVL